MSIAVTASTGQLGRLVLASLTDRGVAPGEIVAIARDARKASDLAEAGFDVRIADYDDAPALAAAFEDVTRALIISGTDFGRRADQHERAARAAAEAGVDFLAYTSALHASEGGALPVKPEHAETERRLDAIGVPHAVLRNGFYNEGYIDAAKAAAASGIHVTATGSGRVSSASRRDLAEAAAIVLTTDGHAGRAYELAGDTAWDAQEFAATVGDLTGAAVEVKQVAGEEYARVLAEAGVPEPMVPFVVAIDEGVARGELEDNSGDLSRLLGRPTTPLRDTLAAALAG